MGSFVGIRAIPDQESWWLTLSAVRPLILDFGFPLQMCQGCEQIERIFALGMSFPLRSDASKISFSIFFSVVSNFRLQESKTNLNSKCVGKLNATSNFVSAIFLVRSLVFSVSPVNLNFEVLPRVLVIAAPEV